MKLAFSTLGCPDWTLKQALQYAKDFGFQGIEIRGIRDCLRADKIEELCGDNKLISLNDAKEKGIELCCLDASASFHEVEKRQENKEEALATIYKAAECGIPYVRIFGNHLLTDDEDAEIIDIAENISYLCDEAEKLGVQVLLEVHGEINCSDRILKAAKAVSRDNFGILWDIKHSDAYEDYCSFWQKTKHLIRHVHIKDSIQEALCNTGEGTLPVAAIVRMLSDDKYEGYFCLEWEKRWHSELRNAEDEFPSYVKFMKEILENR